MTWLAQTTTTVPPGYEGGSDVLVDYYTVAWLIWIALFCVIEYHAIKDPASGDTLSEHVWYWFETNIPKSERDWVWLIKRIVLVGFLVWLLGHFLWGI
jgi:hypothetical protein